MRHTATKNSCKLLTLFCFLTLALTACDVKTDTDAALEHAVVQREPDAATGRTLFVEKGCVTCHAINGIGGKAAPPLDAQTELDEIDIAEFAARMWRGAAAMVELQSLELGYTIWLVGDDLTNLAAFVADASEQQKLSLDDISPEQQDAFLNERFWEVEDWDAFLEQGQEGYGEPVAPTEETQ